MAATMKAAETLGLLAVRGVEFSHSRPRVSNDNPYSESLFKTGICQDTSKKLVRSLFTPEEPQQGLCPYASLPQDIF